MRPLLFVLLIISIGCAYFTPAVTAFPYSQPFSNISGIPFSSISSPVQGESGVIAAGLIVISTPPGGDVWVDGAVLGTTPCTLPGLPSGVHIVTIRMNGYTDWTRTVLIRDRHTINLDAALVPFEPTPCPTITPKPTLTHPSTTPLGTPIPIPTHSPFIFPKPTLTHPSITPLGTPIPVLSLNLIDTGRWRGLL